MNDKSSAESGKAIVNLLGVRLYAKVKYMYKICKFGSIPSGVLLVIRKRFLETDEVATGAGQVP